MKFNPFLYMFYALFNERFCLIYIGRESCNQENGGWHNSSMGVITDFTDTVF